MDKTIYINLNDNTLIVQIYKPTPKGTILWNEMDKKNTARKVWREKEVIRSVNLQHRQYNDQHKKGEKTHNGR